MPDNPAHWHDQTLQTVVNENGAYAIWPANRECPPGWMPTGMTGSKSMCLAYVREHWTGPGQARALTVTGDDPAPAAPGPDLVTRLISGPHRIRVDQAPNGRGESLDQTYLHLDFPDLPDRPRIGVRLTRIENSPAGVTISGDFVLDGRLLVCEGHVERGAGTGQARIVGQGPEDEDS